MTPSLLPNKKLAFGWRPLTEILANPKIAMRKRVLSLLFYPSFRRGASLQNWTGSPNHEQHTTLSPMGVKHQKTHRSSRKLVGFGEKVRKDEPGLFCGSDSRLIQILLASRFSWSLAEASRERTVVFQLILGVKWGKDKSLGGRDRVLESDY